MDAGAEQSLTARTFPPKLLVSRRFVSFQGGICLPLCPVGKVAEAVRLLLEGAVRAITHPDRERGGMIAGSLVEGQPENAALARETAALREAMRERIADALCPFAEPHDLQRMARHLAAVMQGISIQTRDGAIPAELQEIVEDVISGVAARLAVDWRAVNGERVLNWSWARTGQHGHLIAASLPRG